MQLITCNNERGHNYRFSISITLSMTLKSSCQLTNVKRPRSLLQLQNIDGAVSIKNKLNMNKFKYK